MNKKLISLAVITALAVSACGDKQETDNQAASQAFVKEAKPAQADGTVGMLLPNFTELVAREGSTVVNIQAGSDPEAQTAQNKIEEDSSEDPFAEFFKRIVPNQPDSPEQSEEESNFGSGVIISADGYVLTNTHVIKGMNNIKVVLNDKREYPAKLVGSDEKSDIALLKIDAKDLPAAKIGSPNELKSGEWVAAIGAPFGFENSVTAGIVSAKNRTLPADNYMPFIQTDVAINPGNSGGPLFNLKGQVVGINSQIYSRSGGFMGISFAIPIDVAMNVAEQLKTTGRVQRGQLGLVIQEVTYNLAQSFGLDKPTGALVVKVVEGGPAAQAGLQLGDIIRSVDNETVKSSSDLPAMIGSMSPGKKIKLGVWREGKLIELTAVLNEQKDANNESAESNINQPSAHDVSSFEFVDAGLTIGVENDGSLVVRNVKGIAVRAGLRRGDVIEQVAGIPVHNQEEFVQAVTKSGKNIPILVQRAGSTIFFALILP
ncbi:Do family serine endopeptidase [Kingella negevensis]|uniref:Do family serine endopeptidase n=1 Tax=Kingella negevensis TaxID=1522312 RepID=UPI002550E8F5|nr:Do family serine endopeptidase [Kingella negevensis]MDK4679889.1 Do family serine endopeptidase [Kingella negevensis]MDK4682392.1 Do family serine endopeptidase [Kingella negevensis]MDK4690589.1 Do family serine endopeptidase [Kingella negevensis]MDK4692063.1 Do family serine endopeptidase [Kingella negevensis]MDK4700552.1 Do family serine endopeptidase [Kingella negevensis]